MPTHTHLVMHLRPGQPNAAPVKVGHTDTGEVALLLDRNHTAELATLLQVAMRAQVRHKDSPAASRHTWSRVVLELLACRALAGGRRRSSDMLIPGTTLHAVPTTTTTTPEPYLPDPGRYPLGARGRARRRWRLGRHQ